MFQFRHQILSQRYTNLLEPARSVEVQAGAIIPILVLLEMKWYLVRGWTLGRQPMVWLHLYTHPKH